jgi:transcriptional regulator
MRVEHVEGKAKLSQNRSEADRGGVVKGLGQAADPGSSSIAAAMRSADTDAG